MACHSPYHVDNPRAHLPGEPRTLPMPCGKCPPCIQRRTAEWSFRLRKEDEVSKGSYFITLTYAPHTVPISHKGFMTLNPRDLTLLWKRLRKAGLKFKYYACGEYGSQGLRPHYHALIFLEDYMEKTAFHVQLQKAWPLGSTDVGTVTGASVAYTLKYMGKAGKIPMHSNDDRVKEFQRSSNGLGSAFLTPATTTYHKHNLDRNYLTQDGFRVPMPRYYRDKMLTVDDKARQRRIIQTSVDDKLRIDMELHYSFTDVDYFTALREKHYHIKRIFDRRQNESHGIL